MYYLYPALSSPRRPAAYRAIKVKCIRLNQRAADETREEILGKRVEQRFEKKTAEGEIKKRKLMKSETSKGKFWDISCCFLAFWSLKYHKMHLFFYSSAGRLTSCQLLILQWLSSLSLTGLLHRIRHTDLLFFKMPRRGSDITVTTRTQPVHKDDET